MSWIDQGRQEHGWFGHGTASHDMPGEMRARAFAIVDLATDSFANRDDLPFSLEKTTEVLCTFAAKMAQYAGLPPNAFRQRFFKESFDPVDAWTIQRIMREVAASNDHASLVQSGEALASLIKSHGKDGWATVLGGAVASVNGTAKPEHSAEQAQHDYGPDHSTVIAVAGGPFVPGGINSVPNEGVDPLDPASLNDEFPSIQEQIDVATTRNLIQGGKTRYLHPHPYLNFPDFVTGAVLPPSKHGYTAYDVLDMRPGRGALRIVIET